MTEKHAQSFINHYQQLQQDGYRHHNLLTHCHSVQQDRKRHTILTIYYKSQNLDSSAQNKAEQFNQVKPKSPFFKLVLTLQINHSAGVFFTIKTNKK